MFQLRVDDIIIDFPLCDGNCLECGFRDDISLFDRVCIPEEGEYRQCPNPACRSLDVDVINQSGIELENLPS